jgi:hypothetical protein
MKKVFIFFIKEQVFNAVGMSQPLLYVLAGTIRLFDNNPETLDTFERIQLP